MKCTYLVLAYICYFMALRMAALACFKSFFVRGILKIHVVIFCDHYIDFMIFLVRKIRKRIHLSG